MTPSADTTVSCILPTRNRRRFAKQAIAYFQRQDYPRRELVVVDDGDQAVHDLADGDLRIRYVRLNGRVPLGEKLNRGCAAATGDLLAIWSDDAWIAPRRLTQQVQRLHRTGADVSGAGSLLHYDPVRARAWLYVPDENRWLAEPTLCLRRGAWAAAPFAASEHHASRTFLQRTAHHDADLDVSLTVRLLDGSPVPPHPTDTAWRPQPLGDVLALMQEDRAFCAGLRVKARRDQAALALLRITLAAPLLIYDGYGSMAEHLALGLARAGADLDLHPLTLDERGLSDDLLGLLRRSRRRRPATEAPTLFFCWPQATFDALGAGDRRFIYTMWEGSRLPAGWAVRINRARAAFVPTRFVADVFRRSGVRVPIEVVPQGIDPALYPFVERPPRRGVTTLIVSTVVPRKNVDIGVEAWHRAFGDDPAARLHIKSRFRYGNFSADDPRIRYVDDDEPTRGISHWYGRADVLLALGSEGFGLPLVEGMASGLPVVALDAEGQHDVCADAGEGLLLPVPASRRVPFVSDLHGRGGIRSIPAVEAVAERLRWVADHPAEARAMGRAASEWVHARRDVRGMGRQCLDSIERHLASESATRLLTGRDSNERHRVSERAMRPVTGRDSAERQLAREGAGRSVDGRHSSERGVRPLRRAVTLWTPSWGTACGIAEFTADLAGPEPGLRITPGPPPLDGMTLLHVQHEGGLFDEARLADTLSRARHRGIPVVVTDHSVEPRSRLWEAAADVLVSLTEVGARMLAERRPESRVEHIPHGCPTWFPLRKRRKGLVIGAFGFLAPYKGHMALLDALRALPEAELLLVSHARDSAFEERFEAAAAGLPVRRERSFLPADRAARMLAAEADVLVYWYDEIPHRSASGAVRIGLASGVPVLGSPTSWFDDLGEAIYRPDTLTEGIRRLLGDDALRTRTVETARAYCHTHAWPRIRARHHALWRSLAAAPSIPMLT